MKTVARLSSAETGFEEVLKIKIRPHMAQGECVRFICDFWPQMLILPPAKSLNCLLTL